MSFLVELAPLVSNDCLFSMRSTFTVSPAGLRHVKCARSTTETGNSKNMAVKLMTRYVACNEYGRRITPWTGNPRKRSAGMHRKRVMPQVWSDQIGACVGIAK